MRALKFKLEIDQKLEKLEDQVWLIKLAFLCDITRHLNALNLSLQGRNNVLHESVSKLMAFSRKLQLFKQHIELGNYIHFEYLSQSQVPDNFNFMFFLEIIEALISEFNERFETDKMKNFMIAGRFISDPQNFDLDELVIL